MLRTFQDSALSSCTAQEMNQHSMEIVVSDKFFTCQQLLSLVFMDLLHIKSIPEAFIQSFSPHSNSRLGTVISKICIGCLSLYILSGVQVWCFCEGNESFAGTKSTFCLHAAIWNNCPNFFLFKSLPHVLVGFKQKATRTLGETVNDPHIVDTFSLIQPCFTNQFATWTDIWCQFQAQGRSPLHVP